MKRFRFISLLLGLLLLLTACSTPKSKAKEGPEEAGDRELDKVRISAINTVTWAPVFIAETEGFYEENGLEVEFTTPGGPKGFQATHTGDTDFAMLSQEPLLIAQEKGMKSKIVASMLKTRVYGLVTSADIEDLGDLKGKTIFASNPGSAPYVFVDNVVKKAGLTPLEDVNYINMAEQNAGLQAFIKGEVDGAFLNVTNLPTLGDMDYNLLADTTTEEGSAKYLGSVDFPGEMLCTTEKYIEEHPEIVERVVKSLAQAQKWISENSSKDIAKSLAPIFGHIDEDVLEKQIDIVRDKFSLDSMVSEEGQQAVIDMLREAGVIETDIPYDEVIDMDFVIKANEELGL